jgi:phage terminase large subunit-like protein
MSLSLLERLARLDPTEIDRRLSQLDDELTEQALRGAWWFVGRPEQLTPEGNWNIWLILAGRGWGKTRSGSEWLIDSALEQPTFRGQPTEWVAIGETFSETRDVCLDGPSGLLRALSHRGLVEGKDFEVNRGAWQVILPQEQKIYLQGAKNPDVGRGYNLAGAWLDEFAKWRYADRIWTEALAPALRIGHRPRAVITTTPKATVRALYDWTGRSDGSVRTTRGSTFDNRRNLSAFALEELRLRYEGTLIGRQELYGELVRDTEGALWTVAILERARLHHFDPGHPWASIIAEIGSWVLPQDPVNRPSDEQLQTVHVPTNDGRPWRRLIGVDPPGTTAECGIIVGTAPHNAAAGRDHAVILDDWTIIGTPEQWGQAVVSAYRHWQCHEVVVEGNYGGDMVRSTIHNIDPGVRVRRVTASASKYDRAEPISALYARGWIHHAGFHPMLEEQITTWTPNDSRSPDRMDALVHLCVALLKPLAPARATITSPTSRRLPGR